MRAPGLGGVPGVGWMDGQTEHKAPLQGFHLADVNLRWGHSVPFLLPKCQTKPCLLPEEDGDLPEAMPVACPPPRPSNLKTLRGRWNLECEHRS